MIDLKLYCGACETPLLAKIVEPEEGCGVIVVDPCSYCTADKPICPYCKLEHDWRATELEEEKELICLRCKQEFKAEASVFVYSSWKVK
jgi:hypothetical protein